jgi:hypothetical protein
MIFLGIAGLLGAYLFWWDRRYGPPVVDDTDPRPIEAVYRFNHWLPQLLMRLDGSWATGRNRAVTLPHSRRRAAVVYVARHYITGLHRAHEVAGHGAQIIKMGPVDYWCTYVWHYVLRRGSWASHMMERDAQAREARHAGAFGDLGQVPR